LKGENKILPFFLDKNLKKKIIKKFFSKNSFQDLLSQLLIKTPKKKHSLSRKKI